LPGFRGARVLRGSGLKATECLRHRASRASRQRNGHVVAELAPFAPQQVAHPRLGNTESLGSLCLRPRPVFRCPRSMGTRCAARDGLQGPQALSGWGRAGRVGLRTTAVGDRGLEFV